MTDEAALDILGTQPEKPMYGEIGGTATVEYVQRLFRGSGKNRVYGGDWFVSVGVWGLAQNGDLGGYEINPNRKWYHPVNYWILIKEVGVPIAVVATALIYYFQLKEMVKSNQATLAAVNVSKGQMDIMQRQINDAEAQQRAWLDLHRYIWRAGQETGADAISNAVVGTVHSLLVVRPELRHWTLEDDTGAANPETQQWLDAVVLQ